MSEKGSKKIYEEKIKPNLGKIVYLRKKGLTEKEVAEKLGVGYSTLRYYKKNDTELAEALENGKEELIQSLEESLYKRAIGYDAVEKKIYSDGREVTFIKHIPSSEKAVIFALKNLDPIHWKDKNEVDAGDKAKGLISEISGAIERASVIYNK